MPHYLHYLGQAPYSSTNAHLFRLKNQECCADCKEIDLQEWLPKFERAFDSKRVDFYDKKGTPANYDIEKVKNSLRKCACCSPLPLDIVFLLDEDVAHDWSETLKGKKGEVGPRSLEEYSNRRFIAGFLGLTIFNAFLIVNGLIFTIGRKNHQCKR